MATRSNWPRQAHYALNLERRERDLGKSIPEDPLAPARRLLLPHIYNLKVYKIDISAAVIRSASKKNLKNRARKHRLMPRSGESILLDQLQEKV